MELLKMEGFEGYLNDSDSYQEFNRTVLSMMPSPFPPFVGGGLGGVGLGSNGTTNVNERYYCGQGWEAFQYKYGSIHGYISLVVCFFGCLANLLNLIVLTRKGMISPTNAILTGLALADLLNMIEYIPFAVYRIWVRKRYPYGWALFILVHSNFSQVCHTIAIWLTLTLAVWRYIAVGFPASMKTWCTMERAKWAIASAYVVSPLLCTPVYFTFSIIERFDPPSTSEPNQPPTAKYFVNMSELARAHNGLLEKINFWIYSVVIKIIPCIALTVVSFRLINALIEAKRRKAMLVSKRVTVNSKGHPENNNESSSDRTTKMLLAVLLLFLITEFPQGIMGLLSILLGDRFFRECYNSMGDLMDFIALLNSAINFILYCVMSKKFRETFSQIFYIEKLRARATSTSPSVNKHHQNKDNNTLSTTV